MRQVLRGLAIVVLVTASVVVLNAESRSDTANITTADVYQSNGVIHVIDTVVMAK